MIPASPELQLRTNYWADDAARAAYNVFLRQMFQVDMEPLHQYGYWDDDYRPFSLFASDGRVVASACLYSMRMVIAGQRMRVGQISGMAVLPEYRRQGLGRRVAEAALGWAAENGHESFMLFSTAEALPFYRAHGFTFTEEHRTVLQVNGQIASSNNPEAGASVRTLDMAQPAGRALVYGLASRRCPISREIGVLNESLLMFHAILTMRGVVYYIPSLDVAVLFRKREGVLTLYDVVGRQVPVFNELARYLVTPDVKEVVFWFMTDCMGDLSPFGSVEYRALVGNNLHLRGSLPVCHPLVFPFTAQA